MAMLVIARGYMMIILWDSSEFRIGGVRFVMAQIVQKQPMAVWRLVYKNDGTVVALSWKWQSKSGG